MRVLTDFDGSVRIKTCTGGSVYICTSAGVCTAIPAPGTIITGSGTAGTIPLWSASTVLTNSILTQTGTSSVNLGAGAFNYTQVAAPSVSGANVGKLYFDSTSKTLKGSYNAAAYFDFARSNYTTGTLPLGGAGGLLGDSFATQSGANFFITGSAANSVIALQNSTFATAFTVNGLVPEIRGRVGTGTQLLLNGATDVSTIGIGGAAGHAQGEFDYTNGVITLGDVGGGGNNTRASINDGAQLISLRGGPAAQIDVNGGGTVTLGDTQGGGNSTVLTVSDAAQFIKLLPGTSASGLLLDSGDDSTLGDFNTNGNHTIFQVNDSAQTYTANKLLNCLTLGTNGSGVLTCTVSDVGLKENLAPFTRGLFDLMQLRPSFWNFSPGRYYHEGRRYAGLLAQDVQKAIPEAVDVTGDGHAQINPATMQATMVNAIQELKKLIDAQNARIAQLEKQVAAKK